MCVMDGWLFKGRMGWRGKRCEVVGRCEGRRTAVMVSIHKTKGSCVKYRESESAYSFQSWPKTSCNEPMLRWLIAK